MSAPDTSEKGKQGEEEEEEEETFLFSSAPITPRERTPDILVRFQAVASDRPCVDSRTVFISSQCTLIEVRRHIQRHFQCLYERGFIFLRRHREISRSQERAVRLLDIMPRLPRGHPRPAFLFPGIHCKKVAMERAGQRVGVVCVGVVYLCEASSENTWSHTSLRQELSGNTAFTHSFAFIPASITAATQHSLDLRVDEMNQLASKGDKSKLEVILSSLPSSLALKKIKDHRLATPLHYAAQNGHVDVCEAVIGRFGRDILYTKDCNGRTPLHCALQRGRMRVVCYLLHLSPDLEGHDNLGLSCARMLHGLSSRDTRELMTRLEPEVLDPQLVLQLAVFSLTERDIPQALRFCPFAPVVQAPFYRPPLHLAAEIGNADVIKALLSDEKPRRSPYRQRMSAKPSEPVENADNSFETGLPSPDPALTPSCILRPPTRSPDRHVRAAPTDSGISSCSGKRGRGRSSGVRGRSRDPDVVSELDALLEDGAGTGHSPKVKDSDGHLPFHYACQHGHAHLLPLLYFPDMTEADFLKAVRLAVHWRRFEIIQVLPTLREDYSLDSETLATVIKESERDICMTGHTLLPLLRPHVNHLTRLLPHAAMTGAGDVVQTLLQMGVQPDTADFLGRTPLHEACQQNRVHVVGVLLNEAGAEPNVRDWRGSTPLHYACAAGHLEVVEMLMDSPRTAVDSVDVRGRTPLLTAAHCNQQHVLSALVRRHLHRLSPLHTDVEGRSVLHYLCNVPSDVMKDLIQGVKDFKDKNMTPRTPRQDPFSPQPMDAATEATLDKMWADPSQLKIQSARRKRYRRSSHKPRLFMNISCRQCGKAFTCTQRTKNWYHVCTKGVQSDDQSSLHTSSLGKSLVRTPTFLPAGTEISEHDPLVTRRVHSMPLAAPQSRDEGELSPLDVAILNNKTEVVAELVKAFPDLARRTSTAVLAARMGSWETLKMLHRSSLFPKPFLTHLLHVVCMQRPADRGSNSHFLSCLRLLFKLGASPNYIPLPEDFKEDRLSPSEHSLVAFMPLEVAAIMGDLDLAQVLLDNGASASICFAVHLAALKGNVAMLKMLLPQWKEGRWRPYIKGFEGDANELVRVCTLESGLVQAACASQQVSLELLQTLLGEEREILGGRKILTHHMVSVVRPHVCHLSSPSLLNSFLYKHLEDPSEEDHVCHHLPLSSLLRCPQSCVRRKDVERMAVYLVQQGAHLGQIRVSRKSQVHVACQVFVLSVKRRMWKLLEVLLTEAGGDIWHCLLAPFHTCHKYVYSEWAGGESGFLCLSKGMLRIFRLLPLNLLRHFLTKGKEAMKSCPVEALRPLLMPADKVRDLPAPSPRSPRSSSRKPDHPGSCDKPDGHVARRFSTPTLPLPPARASIPRRGSTHTPIPTPNPRASQADPPKTAARSDPPSLSPRTLPLNGMEREAHAQLMTYLLVYHVQHSAGSRGQLMVLCKLTLLCPPLLATMLPVLRYHPARHSWLAHAPRQAVTSSLKKEGSTRRVIQSLSSELMEVALWLRLAALSEYQVRAVQDEGLTVLHVACLWGYSRLIRACVSVVLSPLSPDITSWGGLRALEVAAAQGSTRMMDVLVRRGARAHSSVLLAACVGRAFTGFYPEHSEASQLPDENTKLFVVQWCARTFSDSIDLAFRHPTFGTVFDVILKRRHWAIFDWLLTNIEVAPVSKLLARCPQFAELAQAPEQLLVRFLKCLGEVLPALPDPVMQTFLLTLSARADPSLERVVRRLMALDYFRQHQRLLSLVTARGRHQETLLHNMCRVGHVASLKLFLCLFSLNITNKAEISDFLDVEDRSGCTPLWYCLAHKRWTMAEYLITSGIRVAPRRAVPDFCVKRSFRLCGGVDPPDSRPSSSRSTCRRRAVPGVCNNSLQMVQLLSPGCSRLMQLYTQPPEVTPPQEGVDGGGGVCKDPCPRGQGVTDRPCSDSGYPVSEEDTTVTSDNEEERRRNLSYLLSLVHYAGQKGATLVHAAAAVGDKALLQDLVRSPYCHAQLAFSRTFSPFLFALANSRVDTIRACLQHGLGPYDDDPLHYTLARLVLARCGVRDSEESLRGMLRHQKVDPDTVTAVMDLVSSRAACSAKVRDICTHITASECVCTEHDLVRLVGEVVKARKGLVSDVLLVTAAVTGKLWVFKSIMDSVERTDKLAEQCTRVILPKASFVDLLFLFAPRRMTPLAHDPEYSDRMKILRCLSSEAPLVLQPQTLRAAIRKNVLPMLEVVIKDHARHDLPLQPSSLWFQSLFKGATIGDFHYVNTLCGANLNVKVNILQSALLRAVCLACLHRRKQIVNRLLLFKLPLLTSVTDLPGEFYMQPQLVLEAAIEGGDSVIASLILQTMEETGLSPSQEDILRSIFMAFRKGMEPIIDNLLMFAHEVAPSLVSMNICHRLFLVAARSGHGRICSKFLNLEKLNVSAKDPHGFTALHYACMYNRTSLVRAIIAVAPSSVSCETPEGLTPLDLARCMGNWELAFELIGVHGAARGVGFAEAQVQTQGWMKRLLMLNEQCGEPGHGDLVRTTCCPSREMTIQNLIRRADDRAARCMLEVAQESMISVMLEDYTTYPLLHLCARHGCPTSLLLLLKLVDAQPELDNNVLLEHEVGGMIPLALAIRGGHVACTRHLIGWHSPATWRLKATGESILHLAAKTGQEEIIRLVSGRAGKELLQAQDRDGLIPATSAIAYGHHHVLKPLLQACASRRSCTTSTCRRRIGACSACWTCVWAGPRPSSRAETCPSTVKAATSSSGTARRRDSPSARTLERVLCWVACWTRLKVARAFCSGRLRGSGSPAPTCVCGTSRAWGPARGLSHPLDSLTSWARAGASLELLQHALGSMQLASRPHRAPLFLMLSHMTRFDALRHAVRKKQADLATYLYSKLRPAFDVAQKREFFRHACAQGLNTLVETMLDTDPDLDFLTPDTSHASPLDLALAFGHTDTAALLLQKVQGETILESLSELRALTPFLSVRTRGMLGLCRVGDEEWRTSMDYGTERLSHLDLYLIAHPQASGFPESLLPRDVMGGRVLGREVEVDPHHMQTCVSDLAVEDTWLTAHVLCRAVLGRYHTEIQPESEEWKTIDKITIHCIPDTSDEEARVIVQGHRLHDYIRVGRRKVKDGFAGFKVTTGMMPLTLTSTWLVRERLVASDLPEYKRRLAVLHGLPLDITIDWNSVDSNPDPLLQRRLILALAGEEGAPFLAGLADVITRCLGWLQDLALLTNRKSVEGVRRVLADFKAVVVKFVKEVPVWRGQLDLPLEPRVMWYFSLDGEGGVVWDGHLLHMYVFLSLAHTLFTSLAHPLRRFPHPPPKALTPDPDPDPDFGGDTCEAAEDQSRTMEVQEAVDVPVTTDGEHGTPPGGAGEGADEGGQPKLSQVDRLFGTARGGQEERGPAQTADRQGQQVGAREGQGADRDGGSSTGRNSPTSGVKSSLATDLSDQGDTAVPSDVSTGDGAAFWSMEPPGEDLSRLAPPAGHTLPPAVHTGPKMTEQHPAGRESPVVVQEVLMGAGAGGGRQRVRLVEVADDTGVVLDVDWYSLTFLRDVTALMTLIRTQVVGKVERVADSYVALHPLDLGLDRLAVRLVLGPEGAGLGVEGSTLTLSLYCFCPPEGTWQVGEVEADGFLEERRTGQSVGEWEGGARHLSSSLDSSTRRLTRALGFPVALPQASHHTLRMLCQQEGRQMVPPHTLLRAFLRALGRHVTEGYVRAVTTALTFSGHCWLLGQADLPSSLWCWLRSTDLAKRKASERYLVLRRGVGGEEGAWSVIKRGEVLKADPETVVGVWHRWDQRGGGVMVKEAVTERVQLVTVDGHVFLTTHGRLTAQFMTSLPLSVELGTASDSPLTFSLPLDHIFLRPLELGSRVQPLTLTSPSARVTMECWRLAASLGFQLVLDLGEVGPEDPDLREGRTLTASRLLLETLREVTDERLVGEDMADTSRRVLGSLGTLTVSHRLVERALHIVRGATYGEEVSIYLLTERDLQVAPLQSVWDRADSLPWPRPFSQSLSAALCAAFSLQTRLRLSSLLQARLSRHISSHDIAFIHFSERTDKMATLSMAYQAVAAFLAALTHFVERYLSGMRKLKAELTSVLFTEEVTSGPVVSLQSGVLKVALFKGGRGVEQRTYLSDLLVAVAVDEDIDEEDLAPPTLPSPRVQLHQRLRLEDTCTGLSTASSARRRFPRVRQIVKNASDCKYTVERAVQRLLVAAEAGKTGDLIDSLDIGASVNSVNENGETPLHLAAKGRNYVIQELLLGRGANVNVADEGGMTALHYESGHGDSEAVKLLLSYGADPNAADLMGRTPLHYAVHNSHTDTTDALVFCGADGGVVNKEGRTPRALCQNKAQRAMMKCSDFSVRGLATGNINVDHLVLEADTAYTLEGVGVSLRTPPNLGHIKTRLMMRRVVAEYSTCGLLPTGKEMLVSDIYEFRISGARVEGAVILRVPVYGRPSDYDDVFVKTDTGLYSAPLRAMKQDDQRWVCHVKMFVNDVRAFILVTQPRVERFSVTSSGGDYTSSLNSQLRVHVAPDTFRPSADLALEVLTSPTFEEEEFDNVMSLSHFYSLTPVTKGTKVRQRPARPVPLSLPLPDNFFNEGELFVLLRRAREGDRCGKGAKEQWEVVSKNPEVSDGMVNFRAPDLGLFCLLEKASPSSTPKLSADLSAARYVTRLHRKAVWAEHAVVVFALARCGGSGSVTGRGEAEVVVEVVLSYRLHSRLEHWKGRGFTDHKPCFSSTFTARPLQDFLVQVGGCSQDADVHLPTLLFHPRRDNCMVFTVRQRHLADSTSSWVDVFTSPPADQQRAPSQMTSVSAVTATSRGDPQPEQARRRSTNHVGKLMLKLPWPRTEQQLQEERLIKFAALSPFTQDQKTGILQAVSWGLGSDWTKVAIRLGAGPALITSLSEDSSLTEGQRALQVLDQWRTTRSARQDRGVSELLVSLQIAGRADLVSVVINRLRHWLEEHGVTAGPMAALLLDRKFLTPRTSDRHTDTDLDIPEPMSGEFLRELCQTLGPRFDLAADLDLSKPEVETIMADPLLTSDEEKMFKMLMVSRDKAEKAEDGLRRLLQATRRRGLSTAQNWILHTCRRWMVLHGATDDQFAHAVGEILDSVTDTAA
ncbi:LOW QUALITY PROTEIN: uncharacterized protein LOC143279908 [Babylonia areolata]|uniref:LOW QUALITY PROTEIN: uncharacterized protein LOC143279908 n=1 Tax=Babylonia areolata TaxID=304850 RepID=UPI003FD47B89